MNVLAINLIPAVEEVDLSYSTIVRGIDTCIESPKRGVLKVLKAYIKS
jgi:hypothetical protein